MRNPGRLQTPRSLWLLRAVWVRTKLTDNPTRRPALIEVIERSETDKESRWDRTPVLNGICENATSGHWLAPSAFAYLRKVIDNPTVPARL